MKKHGITDLDKLTYALLDDNKKTISRIDALMNDKAVEKSEEKLRKTISKLFGK